jgi:hypothetical protein
METPTFSEAQLAAIAQLSEALKQCQALDIHIAGITEFALDIFEDANGREYVTIG